MPHVYSILGCGRQGAAAAYDLALRGDASEIRLIDADMGSATRTAERLLRLLGPPPVASRPGRGPRAAERRLRLAGSAALGARVAGAAAVPALRPVCCDVRDARPLTEAMSGSTAVLSALPCRFNVQAARAAIAARCHFNDLGGSTRVVHEELALGSEAERAGVSIVPDCGLAPGMSQTLAVYAMSRIEGPRHVRIHCGGLPQKPRPPLGYRLVFNVAGLTSEYTGVAVCLRAGKVVELPALTELEEVEFPMPVGKCEAFLTSGGTSTAPWTFAGRLETYEHKTVRYKGHFDRVRCLIDLGFLDTERIAVNGGSVVPRELTHVLLEKKLSFPDDLDLVVLRVECSGDSADGAASYRIDLLDMQDPATGFTAMERTTAFSAAIVTYLQASGAITPGALPLEVSVPAERFLSLLERRGFKIVHARH